MKFLYPKFFTVFLFLLFAFNAKSNRVHSVQDGYWNQATTWNTFTVPLSTDSIVIDNYVIISDSVFVDATGNLLIDSCGTLCGNHPVAGHFINYGTMNIHSFHLTDTSFNYSRLTCTTASVIHGSWFFSPAGSSICIGCPPACTIDPRSAACARISAIGGQTFASSFRLSPNPATDELTITAQTENHAPYDAYIYDITGKCVLVHKNIFDTTFSLKAKSLPPGYYVLKLTDQHSNSASRGFIIAR